MPPALSFRAIEKMRDVLMDSSAKNPAVFYYMIRGGESEGNITVIEHGTANGEYIKTYGHYHIIDFIETYTVVLGEAILLLQTRKPGTNGPIDDEIDDFKAIRLQTGDSIKIPPLCGHALVNVGKTWLVTNDGSPFTTGEISGAPQHADYKVIQKMRGMAYYVVSENGQPKLVKNPAYKSVPPAEIVDFKQSKS